MIDLKAESGLHLILMTHLAATWFMIGLIWFVQIVHYPLFDRVGREAFPAYERHHQRRTTWVVAPPMMMELVSAMLIVAGRPGSSLAWTGAALVLGIWLSTAMLQVPLHARLAGAFDVRGHTILVQTNWLRTLMWTARGGIALAMLGELA